MTENIPLTTLKVLDPAIIKEIGEVKNKKILDLGCGTGHLAVFLSSKGAKVTAVDKSADIIKQAISLNKNSDVVFKNLDGAELSDLNSDEYDYVIMNMVLLEEPSYNKTNEIFDEVSRILNEDGKLIFTDIHPISFVNKSEFLSHKLPKNFSYFAYSDYSTEVKLNNGNTVEFQDTHHTLESYTEMLEKASMYIYRIKELKSPNNQFPEFMMFVCKLLD